MALGDYIDSELLLPNLKKSMQMKLISCSTLLFDLHRNDFFLQDSVSGCQYVAEITDRSVNKMIFFDKHRLGIIGCPSETDANSYRCHSFEVVSARSLAMNNGIS